MVKPVSAQPSSYPTPSVPQFSVTVTDTSYNVPPTYTNDPNTGQMVINSSYYSGSISALNVTLTIKNQPLAKSYYSWVSGEGFLYFIQVKPHNSTTWTDVSSYNGIKPSTADSTMLSFQFSNPYFNGFKNDEGYYRYTHYSDGLTYAYGDSFFGSQREYAPFLPVTIPNGDQVDFRVQAGIGYVVPLTYGPLFHGNLSDWNTLAITMMNGETSSASPNPTLSPTPTSTSTVPEFPTLIILLLFAVATLLLVALIKKSKSHRVTLLK